MLSNKALREVLQQRKHLKQHVSAAEWEARVELAACYRLIAHFRMTDWIYNHISAHLPDSHEHYLINPFGLLYEEVSASNLVKVDVHGQARPDVGCTLHTHTAAGVGVSAQAHGLLPISQNAFKVYDRIAYHDFEGIALDTDEQQRLVADIGDKDVLILRNHGLLTMGRGGPQAFELMFFLERACQIQIALAGGSPVTKPAPEVCQRTSGQFAGDDSYVQGRDWQALLRLLDRTDPTYKD